MCVNTWPTHSYSVYVNSHIWVHRQKNSSFDHFKSISLVIFDISPPNKSWAKATLNVLKTWHIYFSCATELKYCPKTIKKHISEPHCCKGWHDPTLPLMFYLTPLAPPYIALNWWIAISKRQFDSSHLCFMHVIENIFNIFNTSWNSKFKNALRRCSQDYYLYFLLLKQNAFQILILLPLVYL